MPPAQVHVVPGWGLVWEAATSRACGGGRQGLAKEGGEEVSTDAGWGGGAPRL